MTVRSDCELKSVCFKALVELVGHVDMERFIVLMNREPRDYTKWREAHFDDDGESIYDLAEKIKSFKPRRIRLTPRHESGCPAVAREALQRTR